MRTILLLAALLLAPVFAQGQDPTLAASYRIDTGRGAGSGVGLTPNIVVTNRHVVGGQFLDSVEVFHTLSKEKHTGCVIAISNVADLSLIWVHDGKLKTAPLASTDPSAGEDVWIIGYGRRAVLRGGTYKLLRTSGENYVTRINTEPGDSGSGLFNTKGELIGLHWGYQGNPDEAWCVPGYRIRKVLFEWARDRGQKYGYAVNAQGQVEYCGEGNQAGGCASGGCADGSCGRGGGGSIGPMRPIDPGGFERPPSPTMPQPQAPPPSPVVVTPTPAPACACNLDEIKAQLAALSETDKKLTEIVGALSTSTGLPGEKGPKGDTGPPGPAPDLDALAAAVLLKIKGDLATPEPSIDLSAKAKISHLVVIVDRAESWYPRLEGEVTTAQSKFPKIHVVGVEQLPWKLSPLPQLVVYDTSRQATQIAKGARDVSAVLQRVQRGELEPR